MNWRIQKFADSAGIPIEFFVETGLYEPRRHAMIRCPDEKK